MISPRLPAVSVAGRLTANWGGTGSCAAVLTFSESRLPRLVGQRPLVALLESGWSVAERATPGDGDDDPSSFRSCLGVPSRHSVAFPPSTYVRRRVAVRWRSVPQCQQTGLASACAPSASPTVRSKVAQGCVAAQFISIPNSTRRRAGKPRQAVSAQTPFARIPAHFHHKHRLCRTMHLRLWD